MECTLNSYTLMSLQPPSPNYTCSYVLLSVQISGHWTSFQAFINQSSVFFVIGIWLFEVPASCLRQRFFITRHFMTDHHIIKASRTMEFYYIFCQWCANICQSDKLMLCHQILPLLDRWRECCLVKSGLIVLCYLRG